MNFCTETFDTVFLNSTTFYTFCCIVWLHQAHVDDIHVICGCLKDFLRSLKEPLVTHRLWKNFVDASGKHFRSCVGWFLAVHSVGLSSWDHLSDRWSWRHATIWSWSWSRPQCPLVNKIKVFSARQHAERAICYRPSVRPSVCPSVRHTGGSVENGWTYHRNSFTIS